MNTPQDALAVDKVHVWRGDRHVLRGVTLALGPGEALHVRGPNGAGKTTLLRVVSGLLRPEQGVVSWRSIPIHADRDAYFDDMIYAADEPALKGDLSALENLRFSVGLKREVGDADLRALLGRVGAAACADLPARVLSAGQRRRVSMARILAMKAPLWLLDEPFTNLDAAGCALMVELLDQHLGAGGLVLVVAHQELELARAHRRMDLAA